MATASGVSMNPEDYFYCAAPSPEQVAEQQRLLGVLQPKSWQQGEQPTGEMGPVVGSEVGGSACMLASIAQQGCEEVSIECADQGSSAVWGAPVRCSRRT